MEPLRVAAVREVFEETGVLLLAGHGLPLRSTLSTWRDRANSDPSAFLEMIKYDLDGWRCYNCSRTLQTTHTSSGGMTEPLTRLSEPARTHRLWQPPWPSCTCGQTLQRLCLRRPSSLPTFMSTSPSHTPCLWSQTLEPQVTTLRTLAPPWGRWGGPR